MADVKVTYFDFAGSRGEEVRLALVLAGVDFDDERISRETFARTRSELPFPHLPIVEIAGRGVFGHSNAILRLIGRQYGLHPDDPFDAARHDALMDAAEELRVRISPSMHMQDEAEKVAARQELSVGFMPLWARSVERLIGDGPFVGGDRPSVADIKLYMVHKWISDGILGGIPADLFTPYPRFGAVANGIRKHPAVVAWYARGG